MGKLSGSEFNPRTIEDIFTVYDTMIVLRPKKVNKLQKQKIQEFLEKSLAKPYDFNFSINNEKMYCNELIYKAYEYAGIKQDAIFNKDSVIKTIKATDFLKEDYKIIFLSKSLIRDNSGIHLNSKMYKNKFIRHYLDK